MGYVGGMVYGNMGKPPYVVWYVLTVWYGKNTVYGMVRLRYGTMVRCRGCVIWQICLVVWYVSVYKVRKGPIRRTNIICNELIYRQLENVRKFMPCGQQTDRQTDRQVCIYQNRGPVLQTENSTSSRLCKSLVHHHYTTTSSTKMSTNSHQLQGAK